MIRRSLTAATLVILTAACAGEEARTSDNPDVDRDTLTRRQKDSIVAEMPLPGRWMPRTRPTPAPSSTIHWPAVGAEGRA